MLLTRCLNVRVWHILPVTHPPDFGLLSEAKRLCWRAFSGYWCKADLPDGQVKMMKPDLCKDIERGDRPRNIKVFAASSAVPLHARG